MPFKFIKSHRAQKAEVKFTPMPSESVKAKCFGPVVFTPLDQTPGLLPLGVAQMSPEIVYRSLKLLDQVVEFEQAKVLKLFQADSPTQPFPTLFLYSRCNQCAPLFSQVQVAISPLRSAETRNM